MAIVRLDESIVVREVDLLLVAINAGNIVLSVADVIAVALPPLSLFEGVLVCAVEIWVVFLEIF